MKHDERALLDAAIAGERPRYAGQRLGINYKRVKFLCEKWATKGMYDYGVTADLGWVTPKGMERRAP